MERLSDINTLLLKRNCKKNIDVHSHTVCKTQFRQRWSGIVNQGPDIYFTNLILNINWVVHKFLIYHFAWALSKPPPIGISEIYHRLPYMVLLLLKYLQNV